MHVWSHLTVEAPSSTHQQTSSGPLGMSLNQTMKYTVWHNDNISETTCSSPEEITSLYFTSCSPRLPACLFQLPNRSHQTTSCFLGDVQNYQIMSDHMNPHGTIEACSPFLGKKDKQTQIKPRHQLWMQMPPFNVPLRRGREDFRRHLSDLVVLLHLRSPISRPFGINHLKEQKTNINLVPSDPSA